MGVIRGLIVQGNEKLSAGLWHFDLPAVQTCPGRTSVCETECYSLKGRFAFPQVRERLEWNYQQAKKEGFVDRMVDELYRKGVLVFRWHVGGDIFSPTYAKRILQVVTQSQHCIHLIYSRSYRVPTIYPILEEMAALPNMRLWLSADAEAYPDKVPKGARVAYMQTEDGEDPKGADLIFRVRRLRKLPLPLLGTVCKQEIPEQKARGVNCSNCQICWRE